MILKTFQQSKDDKKVDILCDSCGKTFKRSNKWVIKNFVSEKHECHSCLIKGKNHPMYGKNSEDYMTLETIKIKNERISKASSGRKHSEETRKKISVGNIGKKFSDITKKKMSISHMGKKLSEETKKKMSKAKKGKNPEDYMTLEAIIIKRQRISKAKKGENNPMFGKNCEDSMTSEAIIIRRQRMSEMRKRENLSFATREKMSNSQKGKKLSDEHKQKLSEAASRRLMENPNMNNKKYKRSHFHSHKNNKDIYCRSSYELLMLNKLEVDPTVFKFNYESVKIPYIMNGARHFTIVDFEVEYKNGIKKLIEVKPIWKLNDVDTLLKINAIKEHCKENSFDFELITEKELGLKVYKRK